MRIHFATWLLEPQQGVVLTKCKADQRLISYYHTKEKRKDLPEYIKTGMVKKK